MHDPDRLWKAWFQPGSFIEYYPIQESLQWLQWQVFGNATWGYHLTNIILHLTSCLLIWRLLARLGLQLAWLGGLLFAVHPMVVESVSLINEFKNTLSLPPFLLALCAWIDFEERKKPGDYFLALGWFLLAMLCKITMSPFPIVILLYAWWKRGRIDLADLEASVPFLVISLFLGWLTIHSGFTYGISNPAPTSTFLLSFPSRCALATTTLAFYFSRVFLPLYPLCIYPQWPVAPPSIFLVVPFFMLVGGTLYLWTQRDRWGRHALLGLGFFTIMLSPFLGLKWIAYMEYTWVIDHFLYIPIIGLIGLVVAALGEIEGLVSRPALLAGRIFLAGLIVLMAVGAHLYSGMFANEIVLGEYTIGVFPGAWYSRYNTAVNLLNAGKVDEAIAQARWAVGDQPSIRGAYLMLGNAYLKRGETAKALEEFQLGVKLQPDIAEGHNNLGNLLLQFGRTAEAVAQYKEAVRLKPSYTEAHFDLANGLVAAGQLPQAIDEFQEALRQQPDFPDARVNLGLALQQMGRSDEAIAQFQGSLESKPDDINALVDLGLTLCQAGHLPEALNYYREALKIQPNDPGIYYNMGNSLFAAGQIDEAIKQYQQSLQLDPNYAEAHNNLGAALMKKGENLKALAEFKQALKLNPNFTDAKDNLGKWR